MGRKKGSKNKIKKELKISSPKPKNIIKKPKKRKKYNTGAIKDEKAFIKKMNELLPAPKRNKAYKDRKDQQAIYVSDKHIVDINLECKYLEEADGGNIFICNNPDAVEYYRKKLNLKNFGDFLLWYDVKKCKFKKIK